MADEYRVSVRMDAAPFETKKKDFTVLKKADLLPEESK